MKLSLRQIIWSFTFLMVLYYLLPYHKIDGELQPYFDKYKLIVETSCPKKSLDIPWRFSLIFDKIDGMDGDMDYIKNDLYKTVTIRINKKVFINLDEDERTSLVFHELTHYFYDKEDINDPDNFMDCCERYTGSKLQVYNQLFKIVNDKCLK